MNKTDIEKTLKQLASARPIFWSEADFQFAFSEQLRMKFPNAKIRLERGFPIDKDTTHHVDIWIEEDNLIYPIELKYKTKKASVTIKNETIEIKDQSAENYNRYAYVLDIERIENIREKLSDSFGEGYAIILSNNSAYYTKPKTKHSSMDSMFRIHNEANLSGQRKWFNRRNCSTDTSSGTRNKPGDIKLCDTYVMEWSEYSSCKDNNTNKIIDFMVCVTTIKH